MKKILVTGGSGLLGLSLKEILPDAIYVSSKDYDLKFLDQVEQMYKDHQPTHILHLAARVGGIVENIKYPYDYFEENILMNSNIISVAKKYNIQKFLAMLTSCAYPNVVDKYPMVESDLFNGPPAKTNFSYAMTKRAMAAQIDACNLQYGTKYNYLMACNIYGEYDNFHDGDKMHFVTALIKKIQDAESMDYNLIKLFGTGKPLRQFMHAHDLARVIKEVINNDITESFNVAPPNQNLSINEMARLAMEAMNVKMGIEYDSTKPDGQFNKEICTKKLTNIFPDFKFMTFQEGILRTINKQN